MPLQGRNAWRHDRGGFARQTLLKARWRNARNLWGNLTVRPPFSNRKFYLMGPKTHASATFANSGDDTEKSPKSAPPRIWKRLPAILDKTSRNWNKVPRKKKTLSAKFQKTSKTTEFVAVRSLAAACFHLRCRPRRLALHSKQGGILLFRRVARPEFYDGWATPARASLVWGQIVDATF